jgi:hypothetical protein
MNKTRLQMRLTKVRLIGRKSRPVKRSVLVCFDKVHARRIDAISLASRLWSVIKNMSEMGLAL